LSFVDDDESRRLGDDSADRRGPGVALRRGR
jgi:hypothetical protein